MFVHDSLSELVMCGETEVGATNFRIKMNTLRKPIAGDPSGATGFQRQFEVQVVSCEDKKRKRQVKVESHCRR